jgi:hypothetical protein
MPRRNKQPDVIIQYTYTLRDYMILAAIILVSILLVWAFFAWIVPMPFPGVK